VIWQSYWENKRMLQFFAPQCMSLWIHVLYILKACSLALSHTADVFGMLCTCSDCVLSNECRRWVFCGSIHLFTGASFCLCFVFLPIAPSIVHSALSRHFNSVFVKLWIEVFTFTIIRALDCYLDTVGVAAARAFSLWCRWPWNHMGI